MQVREISRGNWSVEITNEDKRKIECLVKKLRCAVCVTTYGEWRNMSEEELWEKTIEQFCDRSGPVDFYLKNGFYVKNENNPHFSIVRLDLLK